MALVLQLYVCAMTVVSYASLPHKYDLQTDSSSCLLFKGLYSYWKTIVCGQDNFIKDNMLIDSCTAQVSNDILVQ